MCVADMLNSSRRLYSKTRWVSENLYAGFSAAFSFTSTTHRQQKVTIRGKAHADITIRFTFGALNLFSALHGLGVEYLWIATNQRGREGGAGRIIGDQMR